MRPKPERGSASLELAVLAPGILALVGFVVLAGRIQTSRQLVAQAAEDAARAATLARDTTDALDKARAAAAADLGGDRCAAWDVTLTGSVLPGRTLSATVTCTTLLGVVPGAFTATGTASAVVDVHRGTAR